MKIQQISFLTFWSIFLIHLSTPAMAQFSISNRTSDLDSTNPIFQALSSSADAVESSINNGILSTTSQTNFLDAVADSGAGSNSGLGADYGTNYDVFVMGFGLTGALSSLSFDFGNTTNSLPGIGAAANGYVLFGANMGGLLGMKDFLFLDAKRTNIYLSVMSLSFSNIVDGFDVGFTNFATRFQYRLVDGGIDPDIFNFGGVKFTFGFVYSKVSAGYNTTLNISEQTTISGSSSTATVGWTGNFDLDVSTSNFSIPIEISSHIDLLYALTFVGGVGVNLNFGSTSTSGGATGPVTATSNDSGATGVDNLFSGTGTLDLNTGLSESPTALTARFFGGPQINIWKLRLVTQISYITSGEVHISAGMHIPI